VKNKGRLSQGVLGFLRSSVKKPNARARQGKTPIKTEKRKPTRMAPALKSGKRRKHRKNNNTLLGGSSRREKMNLYRVQNGGRDEEGEGRNRGGGF